LEELDMWAPGTMHANFSYIHIDCDLYAGAHDALTLLSDRISPGALLVFDELVNYPEYRRVAIYPANYLTSFNR
jgi:Macrocin-O-methyltransferase (TylF)